MNRDLTAERLLFSRHYELRRRDNIADLAQAQADLNGRLRDKATRQAETIAKAFEVLDRVKPDWREPSTVRVIPAGHPIRSFGGTVSKRWAVGIPDAELETAMRSYRPGAAVRMSDSDWLAHQLDRRAMYYGRLADEGFVSAAGPLSLRRKALEAQARRRGIPMPTFATDAEAIRWLEARLKPWTDDTTPPKAA